jgi:hypothetical protein
MSDLRREGAFKGATQVEAASADSDLPNQPRRRQDEDPALILSVVHSLEDDCSDEAAIVDCRKIEVIILGNVVGHADHQVSDAIAFDLSPGGPESILERGDDVVFGISITAG